jgi:hypothetical protein
MMVPRWRDGRAWPYRPLPDAEGVPGMIDWNIPAITRGDGSFSLARAPAGEVDVECHSPVRPHPSGRARRDIGAGSTVEIVVGSALIDR